jgi:hypothetical protein
MARRRFAGEARFPTVLLAAARFSPHPASSSLNQCVRQRNKSKERFGTSRNDKGAEKGGGVLAGSERNPESAIQSQYKKREFSRISKNNERVKQNKVTGAIISRAARQALRPQELSNSNFLERFCPPRP